MLIIRRAAPNDGSAAAAIRSDGRTTDVDAKHERPFVIGIDTKHVAALRPADENALTVRQGFQNRRIAEIHIRAHRTRTRIALHRAVAAAHEDIVLSRLICPQKFAGVDVHSHDAVGRFGSRSRCRVSRTKVNRVVRRIDRRRVPDRAARRLVQRDAVRHRLVRPGLVGNNPGFPDLPAGIRIESDNAASRSATRIIRIAASKFFG